MGVGIRHPNSPSVQRLLASRAETEKALAQLDKEERDAKEASEVQGSE